MGGRVPVTSAKGLRGVQPQSVAVQMTKHSMAVSDLSSCVTGTTRCGVEIAKIQELEWRMFHGAATGKVYHL